MDISRQIRDLIIQGFNIEELRTLCSDLGIEYDDLPPGGRSSKARELVAYLSRRGRTADLLLLCAERRPHLDWPEYSESSPLELFDPLDELPGEDQLRQVGHPIWSEPFGEPDWVEIPAGTSWLGWDKGRDNERPAHQVDLEPFLIARYPITNVQYRHFVDSAGYHIPEHWFDGAIPTGYENHPVRFVSFYDAQAYCLWLSQGTGREITLPSEAQWEKASRGCEPSFVYPWGSASDPARANTSETERDATTPVDRFPAGASPFGVMDTCGNVWEWTRSAHEPYPYNALDGREASGESARILRGGAFYSSQNIARCSYRSWDKPDVRQRDDGFRIIARWP